MYRKCPKCGYERKPADPGADGVCPACGLVFAKWVSHTLGATRLTREEESGGEKSNRGAMRLLAMLTHVEPSTDRTLFRGRCALYAVFVVWGCYFLTLDFRSNDIGRSFMHRVDLVFHEAGHVAFMPFGSFMHVLGGSLGQLLIPAIVVGVFVFKYHDNFGGSFGLWWFGQSLKDLAPYINDARDLQLPLLTGRSQDVPETHDWANILIDLNLIYHEKGIALAADIVGSLIMLAAMAWGACLLVQQYRNLEHD